MFNFLIRVKWGVICNVFFRNKNNGAIKKVDKAIPNKVKIGLKKSNEKYKSFQSLFKM